MAIKIPIIDLKKQIAPIRKELNLAIKRVVDHTDFISGSAVGEFEKDVAKYCKVKYALGVSNGTDAIRLSLVALGVQSGEGVICPAFTYYATAGAIASIGATPLFADIDPRTYNISIASIESMLRKKQKQKQKQKQRVKIKAIVPVHLYGQCADMDGVLEIARRYKLKVVEDAAQAFGAEYKGRKAGTMGDCGAVSFFPGKNLGAFGDAGIVLTHNKILAERIRILRNQGNKERYYHTALGFNHRLDAIQAAVLKVKLKYLNLWNKRRQENAAYFNKKLKDLNMQTPFVAEYSTHIYHQYVLRLNSSSKKLVEHLRNRGIDSRIYYPLPLHLQTCFKYLNYKRGDFPESEKVATQILAIPVYPDLTKKEMDHIVASIKELYRG